MDTNTAGRRRLATLTAVMLGVAALVSGDVGAAQARLRAVPHVVSYTGHYLSDFPPSMRIPVVLQNLLTPVLHDVLRQVRGIPGRVDPAYWTAAGAVVLEWKAPVPATVQAVAGVRPGGVEVRVVPRPYSRHDLDAAGDRLVTYLDDHDIDWSELGACASDQGLDLGVRGAVADLTVTPHDLADAAGMPVRVHGDDIVVAARSGSTRR